MITIEKMSTKQRLIAISAIIEQVDNRCMAADGNVSKTLEEMRQSEISKIYALAKGDSQYLKSTNTGEGE